MLGVVADETARVELRGDSDGPAREGARRMLAAALEAEVEGCLAAYAAERDERPGRLPETARVRVSHPAPGALRALAQEAMLTRTILILWPSWELSPPGGCGRGRR
jgi:hypothetical protein